MATTPTDRAQRDCTGVEQGAVGVPVVSEADLRHFFAKGYVVLRSIVPQNLCAAVIEDVWRFTGYSPAAPSGWMNPPEGLSERWPEQDIGMIPLFHSQAMWEVRQHPAVYSAFAQLLGRANLWVSIDRVSFKPRHATDEAYFEARGVHWDIDIREVSFPLQWPRPVQGLVMLADTSAEQGGFHCVPSIYADLEAFVASLPPDHDPWRLEPGDHPVVPVSGKAGDLVIWDSLLPHGNGVNRCSAPRFAQYVTMMPADPSQSRLAEIDCWFNSRAPAWAPSDSRGWEERRRPAKLSDLGAKLLGLDEW